MELRGRATAEPLISSLKTHRHSVGVVWLSDISLWRERDQVSAVLHCSANSLIWKLLQHPCWFLLSSLPMNDWGECLNLCPQHSFLSMLLVPRISFLSALASVCACITCLFFLIYFVLTLIIFILNSQFGDSYIYTVSESRSDDFCLSILFALLVGLSWLLLRSGHNRPGGSRDGKWYFMLSWQSWTACIFSIFGCFIFILPWLPNKTRAFHEK